MAKRLAAAAVVRRVLCHSIASYVTGWTGWTAVTFTAAAAAAAAIYLMPGARVRMKSVGRAGARIAEQTCVRVRHARDRATVRECGCVCLHRERDAMSRVRRLRDCDASRVALNGMGIPMRHTLYPKKYVCGGGSGLRVVLQ